MIKPNLFDVVELLTDIPERNLKKGEQGAIIEDYQDGFFEIEFCNNYGETIALCPILKMSKEDSR
ncbi:MAG: DUF4926 domain-containing protein [Cyanobacterium sp. T60_A2020_053]|nr:DUF4926 domain-containing protein [Cyanobacterium sp. T60_A2020_053]